MIFIRETVYVGEVDSIFHYMKKNLVKDGISNLGTGFIKRMYTL